MTDSEKTSRFRAKLQRPKAATSAVCWAFVVLPIEVSETLPRRGRTSVTGTINGHALSARLEPDGQKSHWLKLDWTLLEAAGVNAGDTVEFNLAPAAEEPEPEVPEDLHRALQASAAALTTWEKTTAIAHVDWIHWIESAKQAKTRAKRINDACDMLASGKKRVCCFDNSGFYSKALSAPEAAD